MFDEYGARAQRADCALLTAFGYDFVPGNLAGALALREAADGARRATRVEIFYVTTGGGPSGGTMASGISVMLRPGFAFRDGRLTGERQGARVAAYRWGARSGAGCRSRGPSISRSPGSTASFAMSASTSACRGHRPGSCRRRRQPSRRRRVIEPLGRAVERAWSMAGRGSTGGPSESARRRARAGVLARALDESGDRLAEVRLEGGDPYEFARGDPGLGSDTGRRR